jgi:hypothetical protein
MVASTSTEYLSESSPHQPFPADFLAIPPSPLAYSQSPPPARHIPPEFFAAGMRQTASVPSTPLKERSVVIEPLSAVAIFALLTLYPVGTLIGITDQGTFEIHLRDTWGNWAFSAWERYMKSQNGDQLTHLIAPIEEACRLYGTSNPNIGMIFIFARLGIDRLKSHYKERKLVIETLDRINSIFEAHVQKCQLSHPLPSIITPHFAFSVATTSYAALPMPSAPSTSTPTLIPSLPPRIASLHCWTPKELEDFAQDLVKMITNASEPPEARQLHLQYLLQQINQKQASQRTLMLLGRSL